MIVELQGLKLHESHDKRSKECLDFIVYALELGLISVQTLTGESIQSIEFREKWDEKVESPDDAILFLCSKRPESCVVTNDINLRLKARASGVIVMEISQLRKIFRKDS